jgi:hypothetical protein
VAKRTEFLNWAVIRALNVLSFGDQVVIPVTAGEKLYLLVRDTALESWSEASAFWSKADTLLGELGGSPGFPAYIKGAAAVHATRRILRYWADEKSNISDEAQYVRKISAFIRGEIFSALPADVLTRMARYAIDADLASGRPITPGCRKIVLSGRRKHSCYLCGKQLTTIADPKLNNGLTLEHLWPTSIGGDSVEANLLPACCHCQLDSQDAISWEWINVHNIVLSSAPSDGALKSVNGRFRYARHYFEAMTIAETNRLTLKQAFLALGHIKSPLTYEATHLPVTFFDLRTV